MSRHLLRTAMAMSIAALAFSFAGPVRAADSNAPAATPKPRPRHFTGLVESIDSKAGTAIVKKDAESKTFKITDKTKYATLDKKEATVADIKVGDKVTVAFTEDAGILTAVRIGPTDTAKKKEKEEKKD